MSAESKKPEEKNLPGELRESPKQKPLIIAFSVLAVVALIFLVIFQVTSGQDDFLMSKNPVIKAFKNQDAAALAKLASKEFLVGQPESVNSTVTPNENLMGRIIKFAANAKWSDRYEDYDQIRILSPEKGNFQLMFHRDDKGWTWSGFITINPDDLAGLLNEAPPTDKIEYKDVHTDEATGNEPSLTE